MILKYFCFFPTLIMPILRYQIGFELCTAAQWVALITAFSLYWALGKETWIPFGRWDNSKPAGANNGGFSTFHTGAAKSLCVVYVIWFCTL